MTDESHGGIVAAICATVVALSIVIAILWWALAVPDEPYRCRGGAFRVNDSYHECPSGAVPGNPPIENWNGSYMLICVCPGNPDVGAR